MNQLILSGTDHKETPNPIILQTRNLRLREVKQIAEVHTARSCIVLQINSRICINQSRASRNPVKLIQIAHP